jgi:hypothetical protein
MNDSPEDLFIPITMYGAITAQDLFGADHAAEHRESLAA